MLKGLSAERLGLAGESKFTNMCDLADLMCNKSNRDETGWDFLIEFPMTAPRHDLTLDQRAPVICHVQLKTTAVTHRSRVSLKLSAVERLAKNVHPTLIVVFVARPDGEVSSAYVIHLLDAPLAHILERLRRAHARGKLDVNRLSLTFDYRQIGTQFEVTPEGLRNALTQACGADSALYVKQKQAQLDELGYGEDRYYGEASFTVRGPGHLNEILWGRAPLIPEQYSIYENRFGIRIPLGEPSFPQADQILFEPPVAGVCKIAIHGPSLSLPATFSADVLMAPRVFEHSEMSLLLKHPDIELKLTRRVLGIQTVGEFDTVARSLHRWVQLTRALSHLVGGRGSVSIRGLPEGPREVSFPLSGPISGPNDEFIIQLSTVLEGWQRLLNTAGVESIAEFTLDHIQCAVSANVVVELLINSAHTTSIVFAENEAMSPLADQTDVIYYNNAALADAAISFTARLSIIRTHDPVSPYRAASAQILDVRAQVENLEEYAKTQADAHNIRVLMGPNTIQWILRSVDAEDSSI
jgi:hypothetical protein